MFAFSRKDSADSSGSSTYLKCIQAENRNLHKQTCAQHSWRATRRLAQSNLRRALAQRHLRSTLRVLSAEQLAQGYGAEQLAQSTCAEQLVQGACAGHFRKATCKEHLGTNSAQSDLHKAKCAGHSQRSTCSLAQSNLGQKTSVETATQQQLERSTSHRAVGASHSNSATYLRKEVAQSNWQLRRAI